MSFSCLKLFHASSLPFGKSPEPLGLAFKAPSNFSTLVPVLMFQFLKTSRPLHMLLPLPEMLVPMPLKTSHICSLPPESLSLWVQRPNYTGLGLLAFWSTVYGPWGWGWHLTELECLGSSMWAAKGTHSQTKPSGTSSQVAGGRQGWPGHHSCCAHVGPVKLAGQVQWKSFQVTRQVPPLRQGSGYRRIRAGTGTGLGLASSHHNHHCSGSSLSHLLQIHYLLTKK